MSSLIRVVDISAFTTENGTRLSRESTALELVTALSGEGMVLVSGHGVSTQIQEAALESARTLFALPVANKEAEQVDDVYGTRGYLPIGEESGSSRHENKEGFSYGLETRSTTHQKVNGLRMANRWPSPFPPSGVKKLNDLYSSLCRVCLALTKAIGLALNADEDSLLRLCTESSEVSLMRCFHYLRSSEGSLGSSPHTDWGFLTLIMPDPDSKGLEVFLDEKWHDVRCSQDYLVANCGDFLTILTRGRLSSPIHRVTLSQEERVSFVLFFYPNFDTNLEDVGFSSADDLQSLSLFADQTLAGTGEKRDMHKAKFGDIMLNKWAQVRRKT
ncbi:hypothetical protein NDN08_004589 [Rhodosorus marinus]|uniref:Fe2OG dioxygenase domain-containing protein n=1 Tax=Rhodosorus marinus TaxID=101924 RepID=A0AAV8ULV4_9RHOD|nr:hypothetical protein NDN08_004589 [Rhodosorus marinus]